jgi:hypothetical protein
MTIATQGVWRQLTAVICTALIAPGTVPLLAQQPPAAPAKPAPAKPRSAEQLDSLVAPIALYPDPLLAQVLAASTYPLEIVQCHRWLKANPKLTGEDLTKAAAKQPWDASVQALVAFPQALKLLDENIQWTTDLGNAFLDQQSEVMDAVQRMRKKAKDGGKLESTKEQKVEVKMIENKTIVEIQPSNPQVIYVPSYNPTVVYGPPVYAYPPIYYPPYPTGAVVATAAISFGVGVAMGAFWGGCCGGGWGWGCGWGGNNNITINNNFQNRYGYSNISGGNRTNISGGDRVAHRGGNNWQHNPDHRRAVPYSDRSTAQRFGGSTRDSSGRTERFDRSGQPRASTREAGGGFDRGSQASTRDVGSRDRGQSGLGDSSRGQDRMGDRSIGSDRGRQSSAFGGADSRDRSTAASNRGFSSSRQSSVGSSSRSGGGYSGRSGGGRSFGGGGGRRR